MPVREYMTWVPSRKQWTKRYKGHRYYISARQLGCLEETKEASRERANTWWEKTRAVADLADRPVPRTAKPMDDVLAALLSSKPWENYEDVAKSAAGHLETLPPSNAAETLADAMNDAAYSNTEEAYDGVATALGRLLLPQLWERLQHGQTIPDKLREHLPPARVHQIENGAKMIRGGHAALPDKTVKALTAAWLETKKAQAGIGALSASRYSSLRAITGNVLTIFGEDADASTIDGEALENAYRYCLSQISKRQDSPKEGWSERYARETFTVTRTWVKWLSERGIIDLPKNIESRQFAFGAQHKRVSVWTVEEVHRVIGESSGILRLAILLQLNCGMSQKDVSDLREGEVEWHGGRIIRKRSKTRANEHTPEVNYKLWPETFAALQGHRSGKERVLLTKRGLPYVNRRMVAGRFHAVDSIGDFFRRLAKRIGCTQPLKGLRKTSATLLESHAEYHRFASLFLGHAPQSMKDRHYAAVPQERFDAAIEWLGSQFGY